MAKIPKKTNDKPPKEDLDKFEKPYDSNQYLMDPRQKLCWELYIDPKSETFGNGRQSAIKAGYDEGYANRITTIDWWLAKVRRLGMLSKAERNLDEFLDMPTKTMKTIDEEEYVQTDPALVRIKLDSTKFVAERLGKDDGYATRKELTGAGGGEIKLNIERQKEIEEALGDL